MLPARVALSLFAYSWIIVCQPRIITSEEYPLKPGHSPLIIPLLYYFGTMDVDSIDLLFLLSKGLDAFTPDFDYSLSD